MTEPEFHGVIDFPRKGFDSIWGSTFLCIGWAVCVDPITNIDLKVNGETVGKLIRGFPRPDVVKDHPKFADQRNCGFYGQASAESYQKGKYAMSAVVKTATHEFSIGPVDFEFHPELFLKKKGKILDLLRCPECGGRFSEQPTELACMNCKKTFRTIYQTPFFVDDPESAISPRTTPSSPYSERAKRIIKENQRGIVLDCGSGYPLEQYENVIQVDMEKYPSTDCVADVLQLPFQDECFDGIISQSVIEHVRNPFAYVAEMQRILKDGGYIVADTGFLQPLHAYPNHYFNTSISGMQRLFRTFEHIESGVAEYQVPWYMLRWVLNSYSEGIEDAAQRVAFLKSTMEDALKILNEKPNKYPYEPLRPDSVQQLACGVYFFGRKRSTT